MNMLSKFVHSLRHNGVSITLIKTLGALMHRRVLIQGFDTDYPALQQRDLSMPDDSDVLATHADYSRWKHVIPLPNARMMLHIGAQTVENFFVVADAWAQVLSRFIQPNSHVLDIGCGCGRTARLLVNNANITRYTGFDVIKPYITWCNQQFSQIHGDRFQFHHLDVRTERYNPNGTVHYQQAQFPAQAGSVDFLFAASLFTHLYPEDTQYYASQMSRVLKAGGQALVSIHDQPQIGEQFTGSEHRADFSAEFFLSLMREAGLELSEDIGDLCGQRTFLLKKS